MAKSLIGRVKSLMGESYAYMHSPEFRRKGVEAALFGADFGGLLLPDISWYKPTLDSKSDDGRRNLMSPQLERMMFLRFNFAKHELTMLKAKFSGKKMSPDDAKEFMVWHRRFTFAREYITRSNLALVLSMGRRLNLRGLDFSDFVSEGNGALLNAVNKFDVERGFKFSTYACRAILKNTNRAKLKEARYRMRYPQTREWKFPDRAIGDRRQMQEEDLIGHLRDVVQLNRARLSPVEQTVIFHRFNWKDEAAVSLTLEEVGQIVGVTKERVRQIQNQALGKLRAIINEAA